MAPDWTPADRPEMTDAVVVVTGANSGLGFEGTRLFAEVGATVVMACRTQDRGQAAASKLRDRLRNPDLRPMACDLSSLDSVASFATEFRSSFDRLDVLCNNAGVMAIPRTETADGFEEQFGVNHLGHFALTGHLLPTLANTPGGSRVVTQSSGLHERGTIDFDDLHGEREYDKWAAYGQSKLANLLFAYELDRRTTAAGLDVTSVGCHPGYAATDLQSRGPERAGSRVRGLAMRLANTLFGQPPSRGAEPMVYAATDPTVDGGAYVGPGGLFNMRGHPSIQSSNEASYDEADAARLWEVSEALTGVEYDFEASSQAA